MWRKLYDWVLKLSAHPKATWWLGGISVAESSFFPVPVDVMLAPMVMAQRERAWFLAGLTTVCSVIGGVIGFFIGMFMIEAVTPLLKDMNYWDSYLTAQSWFVEYGFLAVFVAGFTPIPFKVFTIAAGASGMSLPLFILASLIGRAGRFFLVAGLVYAFGEKLEERLLRYIDIIGWVMLALIVAGVVIYKI